MVQFFLEKGAKIGYVAHKDGATPLLRAVKGSHKEVVAYLQEKGANIEATDKEGKTPLMIAKQYGRSAVVQFLEGAQEHQ